MTHSPALYVHIPYCKQACHYCDFHFSTGLGTMARTMKALNKELETRLGNGNVPSAFSLYFGGGTPSILPLTHLESIFQTIAKSTTFENGAEITLEANPDDLLPEKLEGWKRLGINRLSIGVQSFNNNDLRWMNRAHSADEALVGLERAANMGFNNLTADLIYGLPNQPTSEVLNHANQLLELGVTHLSAYALTVEPKTALDHFISTGKTPAPQEENALEHYLALCHFLESKGWEHYEVSNWCAPGRFAKHNSAYWSGRPYLGFGPSAHSYHENKRSWNVANNTRYALGWENNQPEVEGELLTPVNRTNELLMTGLRTKQGVDLQLIPPPHRKEVEQAAQAMLKQGLLLQQGTQLFIPENKWFQADGIASNLFVTN